MISWILWHGATTSLRIGSAKAEVANGKYEWENAASSEMTKEKWHENLSIDFNCVIVNWILPPHFITPTKRCLFARDWNCQIVYQCQCRQPTINSRRWKTKKQRTAVCVCGLFVARQISGGRRSPFVFVCAAECRPVDIRQSGFGWNTTMEKSNWFRITWIVVWGRVAHTGHK